MFELYIYAEYKSHDDVTLSYLEDAFRRFHTIKNGWFLRSASNEAKAKANALITECMK
jgi:hypothetical protein